MGDGVGFDVGFTGVGLSLLVFVFASGFSPDTFSRCCVDQGQAQGVDVVLLTGI
jgi:hypothetical protein